MTTWEYIIDGILAGTSAKMLIEQLSQLKSDRARGLAKRTGLPIEQMTAIAEIDPTANGSYMDWLAKIVKNAGGNLPAEPDQIRSAIVGFEAAKKIPAFQGNKNILQYPTFDALADVVNQSQNLASNAKKEAEVKKLFAEIDKRFPLRLIDPTTGQLGNKPVLKSGYFPWLMGLIKKDDIILPEDSAQILDAITKFEAKRQDANFTGAKSIERYPTLASLISAVTRGEKGEEVTKSRDRLPDEPGIKFVSATEKYGHYYDLYAVTTPDQASKNFNPAGMGRKSDGGQFRGWCVKDPTFFKSASYRMGPENPAYMFRKDGIPYALSDIYSGNVKDRDDNDANAALSVELLGLEMPDKLRKAIINKNAWTRSHADLIEKEGIDQAVTTIFKKAAGEFGGSSTAAQLAAKDAIEFMKNFGWKYPTQEALSYIYSNPWLAMGYAARSIKDWVPDLHPIIEQTPAALAAYYSMMVKELKKDPSGFPDYKQKAFEWASKGNGQSEDGIMCYLPLAMYVRNTGDTSGITPELTQRIKKDAPIVWNFISKSMEQNA